MICYSISLMTAVDFLIVGLVGYAVWVFARNKVHLAETGAVAASTVLIIGLLIIGAFHLVDLFTMWVLPRMVSAKEAATVTELLHLNLSWIEILLAVASVVAGFAIIARRLFALLAKLED